MQHLGGDATREEGHSMPPPPFQLQAGASTNLARTPQQSSAILQRKIDDNYPWDGAIIDTWSAALRAEPKIDPNDPHKGTIADIPKDTRVTVVGRSGNWLKVEVMVKGEKKTGYISQELVHDANALKTAAKLDSMLGEEATWRGSGPGSGTTFEQWASAASEAKAPPLGASTVINCWEMILYAAYKAKVLSWAWIHDLYAGSGKGKFPNWEPIMAASSSPYLPGKTLLNKGELIFFDGIDHVAMATGSGDEIYTFWPPPDTKFAGWSGTLDRVKTSTIKALSDYMAANMGGAPKVTHGMPAW